MGNVFNKWNFPLNRVNDDDKELDPERIVQVKWLGGPELYTARIVARITSFTYEVHIQQQWVICIGWHKHSMSHLLINYNKN